MSRHRKRKQMLAEQQGKKVQQPVKTQPLPKGYEFISRASYLGNRDRHNVVRIDMMAEAYLKMRTLVDVITTEVGWNATVRRIDKTHFVIERVLVYPQVCSGTRTFCDNQQTVEWENSLSDEDYNEMRFHGHSHVYMATIPSGIDDNYQETILARNDVKDDDNFFIFMILNKRGDYWLRLYDKGNDETYTTVVSYGRKENDEIDFHVICADGSDFCKFIDASVAAVKKSVPVTPSYYLSATRGNDDDKNPWKYWERFEGGQNGHKQDS